MNVIMGVRGSGLTRGVSEGLPGLWIKQVNEEWWNKWLVV